MPLLMPVLLILCLPIINTDPGEQLREAARLGQLEEVKRLLDSGVAVDDKNQFGVTALYLAANGDHVDICQTLIDAGADINVKDNAYGFPLVQMAAWKGRARSTRLLIEAGADGAIGAMFAAASTGQANVIQVGLDLNVIPKPVMPQLMASANSTGQTEVVELLASLGVPRPVAPEAPIFIELSTANLEKFAGAYVSATEEADRFVVFVRDGQLHVGRSENAARPIQPVNEVTFAYPSGSPQRFVFDVDEAGKVSGYRLVSGTSSSQRKRVSDDWRAAPMPTVQDAPIAIQQPQPWPQFRGARGNGIADGQHPPLRWSVETKQKIRWKIEPPGFGHSSPVVWGDKVFITTAIGNKQANSQQGELGWIDAVPEEQPHEWRVLCYNARDGKLLWEHTARRGIPQRGRHWKASQANCTIATDGKVLIAFFGSEGLYAYDLDGKPLWKKDLGILDAGWYIDASFPWGFASSPILHDDKVYLQCDVHGQSFVAAYDAASGKELWRKDRDEIPSWCTPTIFGKGDAAQLVVNATGAIRGYCPQTGKELWQLRGNSHITVASPVCTDSMILATGGYQPVKPIYAIKPDAEGDITPEDDANEDLLWHYQTGGVYQSTPLLYRGLAYLLNDNGILTCYRQQDGKKVYRKRVGGSYTASPIAADGRLYLTSEDGDIRVLQAGEDYQLLAHNEVDDVCLATPAISNGALFVRTERFLMAIAHK